MHLTFEDDGWIADRAVRVRPIHWACGFTLVLLALAFGADRLDWPTARTALLIAAVLPFLVLALLALFGAIGILYLAAAAFTSHGRQRLRDDASGILADVRDGTIGTDYIPLDMVVSAAAVPDAQGGTTVEVTLDDGTTWHYRRPTDELLAPFTRLLGDRLTQEA